MENINRDASRVARGELTGPFQSEVAPWWYDGGVSLTAYARSDRLSYALKSDT